MPISVIEAVKMGIWDFEPDEQDNCRLVKVAITLRVMIGNKHWTVVSRTLPSTPERRSRLVLRAA